MLFYCKKKISLPTTTCTIAYVVERLERERENDGGYDKISTEQERRGRTDGHTHSDDSIR